MSDCWLSSICCVCGQHVGGDHVALAGCIYRPGLQTLCSSLPVFRALRPGGLPCTGIGQSAPRPPSWHVAPGPGRKHIGRDQGSRFCGTLVTACPGAGGQQYPGATDTVGVHSTIWEPGQRRVWTLVFNESSGVVVRDELYLRHEGLEAFYPLSYLEKLDMSRNNLSRLPPDFSDSLSSLKELQLERNALKQLEPPCLERLESLEKLDLSHNRISTLQPGAFRGLSRLRHLYLQGNQLTAVLDGAFSALPSLEMLLLGDNNVTHIQANALAPLRSLALLGLEGNQLEQLKFRTFLNLHTAGTHLQLSGNPWHCDCELHRVFSKLLSVRHLHVDDYRNVTCRQPWQLAGASLAWVDSQLCVAETVTVLVITGTVLVTVFGALVMAERNRKKKKQSKHWGQGETDS
ncbi:hypothetical protein NFI96_017126 [Prochilodus magdalenae]|nr:hypothetical protein NFI96_017126 [Prochilodus magdalenae]